MIEEWKVIEDYPNYMVSNCGRVKSLNYHRSGKEGILKYGKNHKGYWYVVLCKNGKMKNFLVHRLVAQAFLPNPDNLPQVNHKDECKTNNCVTNLEWCNNQYNVNYGTRNKRASKPVLQIDKVTNEVIREWPSGIEIQKQLGFAIQQISKCCNEKPMRYTAYGYKWKFKEVS